MKNTGKEFEKLSHKVFSLLSEGDTYSNVELDVELSSPDGPRQFDVVIRSKVSGLDILTVIECRDFNKNLTITHVDGLHSKARDVNADKIVLVARKGFSRTAKQKADRLGITLCTIHDVHRNLDEIGFQLPVTLIAIDGVNISVSFDAYLQAGTKLVKRQLMDIYINGEPILDIFKKRYLTGNIDSIKLNVPLIWIEKSSAKDKIYFFDSDCSKVNIREINIHYIVKGEYYFGHVHDLPESIGIRNISQGEINMFFNSKDVIFDYKKNLKHFNHIDELPQNIKSGAIIVRSLEINLSTEDFNLNSIQYLGKDYP